MSSSTNGNMNNQQQHSTSSSSSSTPSSKHKRKNYHYQNYHNRYVNNNYHYHNHNITSTNCIILKNLHYNMTQDTLVEVIERVMQPHEDAKFTNIQLVDDKHTGTFKGIAFVTFASIEHASIALNEMNKVAINGRKVFAEYRRVPRHQQQKNNLKQSNDNLSNEITETPHPNESNDEIIDSNNNVNGGEEIDKRALFFAKRGTDKEKEKKDKVNAKLIRQKEDSFRKLLKDYVNGKLDLKNNAKSDQSVNSADKVKKPLNIEEQSSSTDIGNENTSNGINGISENSEMEEDNTSKDSEKISVDQPGVDTDTNEVNGIDLEEEENTRCESSETILEETELKGVSDSDSAQKNNEDVKDLIFDASLTSLDRRIIHVLCDEMKLGHISRFDNEGNRVLHVTKDKEKAESWAVEAAHEKEREKENTASTTVSTTGIKTVLSNPNKVDEKGDSPVANSNSGLKKLNYTRPRGAIGDDGESGSGLGLLSPSYKVWTPKRQPTGPPRDGKMAGFERRRKFHGIELEEEKDDSTTSSPVGKEDNGITTPKQVPKIKIHTKGKGKGKGAKDKLKDKDTEKELQKEKEVGKEATTKKVETTEAPKIKPKSGKKSKLDPNVPPFSPMNNQFTGTGAL